MEQNYIVADLETGGFEPDKNPITSIAMIILNHDLEEIGRYETLIKPYDNLEITKEALENTGQQVEELIRDGKEIQVVFKEICALFKEYKNGYNLPILVGHNFSKFDAGSGSSNLKNTKSGGFLFHLFQKFKDNLFNHVENFIYDTLHMAKLKGLGEIANYQLRTVCEALGVDVSDSHNAMNDTEANAELFKLLVNLQRNNDGVLSQKIKEKSRSKFKLDAFPI